MQPPAPRSVPVETTQLGRSRTDFYAWMKDEKWQKVLQRPEILREDIAQHLRAENAYADASSPIWHRSGNGFLRK